MRFWVLAAFLFLANSAFAVQIPVANTNSVPMAVWVWDDQTRNWNFPTRVAPGGRISLTLPDSGDRYIVATDSKGGSCILGWIDAGALLARDPAVTLVVGPMTERITKNETYTVWKDVHEQQEVDVPVWRQVWIDGHDMDAVFRATNRNDHPISARATCEKRRGILNNRWMATIWITRAADVQGVSQD